MTWAHAFSTIRNFRSRGTGRKDRLHGLDAGRKKKPPTLSVLKGAWQRNYAVMLHICNTSDRKDVMQVQLVDNDGMESLKMS